MTAQDSPQTTVPESNVYAFLLCFGEHKVMILEPVGDIVVSLIWCECLPNSAGNVPVDDASFFGGALIICWSKMIQSS